MHGRFMCMFCIVDLYVFCMCLYSMSSLPRTLLHTNLSPKYPYFSSILFVHVVFAVFFKLVLPGIVDCPLCICTLFHGGV